MVHDSRDHSNTHEADKTHSESSRCVMCIRRGNRNAQLYTRKFSAQRLSAFITSAQQFVTTTIRNCVWGRALSHFRCRKPISAFNFQAERYLCCLCVYRRRSNQEYLPRNLVWFMLCEELQCKGTISGTVSLWPHICTEWYSTCFEHFFSRAHGIERTKQIEPSLPVTLKDEELLHKEPRRQISTGGKRCFGNPNNKTEIRLL
jgi:hypothetical protein